MDAATYISEYSFSVYGDQTEIFQSGINKARNVRCDCDTDGIKCGQVLSSTVSGTDTIVTLVSGTSQALTSNFYQFDPGNLGADGTGETSALTHHDHKGDLGSGGQITESAISDLDKYTQNEVTNLVSTMASGIGEEGRQAIANNSDTVTVTFDEELADIDYAAVCSIENTSDPNPAYYSYLVTDKSTTGFTLKLSTTTDSANYVLAWRTGRLLGEGGGTDDHSALNNLDYASAGHTGFSPDTHNHDGRYYTETELNAGQLDNRYYTETETNALLNNKSDITHNHDNDYVNVTGDTMTGNLIIEGDLMVSGTTYYTQYETLQIEDNYITVNHGETGVGVTAGEAGLQIDRGTEDDYYFQFDEVDDVFRVGVSGSLQAVATREDNPTDTYVPYWNDSAKRFDTVGSLAYTDIATQDDITSVSGLADGKMSSFSDDTSPTAGGNIVMNGNSIDWGTTPTVDGTWKGDIKLVQVDDAATVPGDVLYQAADFNYERADADTVATSPVLYMALESGSGVKYVLKNGEMCKTAWAWTAGKLYMSTITGEMTQTKPSGGTDQVQPVGWALSSNAVAFEPNLMVVEV